MKKEFHRKQRQPFSLSFFIALLLFVLILLMFFYGDIRL